MIKKRVLFLSKLFLILILSGGIALTAQDGSNNRSGGCGGGKPKIKANASNENVSGANVSNANMPKANVSDANRSNDAGAGELGTRRWNLVEIGGDAVEGAKAFVEFDAAQKRFSGNAGCNRMFGKFEISGNKIKFSGIGATRMFCGEAGAMKLETDFLKALETATRFERAGDALIFYAKDDLILKFSGAAKNADSNSNSGIENSNSVKSENSNRVKLEDKKWILETIAGKPAPKIEKEAFLIFDKEKMSAGGFSGCNSFGGNYKTDADKIVFAEIVQTFMACEDERGAVERALLGGLPKANRFEIKSGTLNLYEDAKLLLAFAAREKKIKAKQTKL